MKLCCRRSAVACNNAHVRTVSPGPLLGRRNATRRCRFGDVGHRSTERAQRPGRAGFAAAGADTELRACVRNAPALPRSPSPIVSCSCRRVFCSCRSRGPTPLTPSLLPQRPVAFCHKARPVPSPIVGRRDRGFRLLSCVWGWVHAVPALQLASRKADRLALCGHDLRASRLLVLLGGASVSEWSDRFPPAPC